MNKTEYKFIKHFNEITTDDLIKVGNKSIFLSTLSKINIPILPGFCITTKAFYEFCENLNIKFYKNLSEEQFYEQGKIIQETILNAPLDNGILLEINNAYKELLKWNNLPDNYPLIIRPSLVVLESDRFEYSGILETVCNVNRLNLENAIKQVWASLFSKKSLQYTLINKKQVSFNNLALIVQIMIESDKGGIASSFNPLNTKDDEIFIESIYGIGQIIFSGPCYPDTFIWNRFSKSVISKELGEKIFEEGIINNTSLFFKSKRNKNEFSLNENEINVLVKIFEKILSYYSYPLIFEWLISNNTPYIWQIYPISKICKSYITSPQAPYYLIDYFPEPISFFAQDFFIPIINRVFINICKDFNITIANNNITKIVDNKIYINENEIKKILEQLPEFKLDLKNIPIFIKIIFNSYKILLKWKKVIKKYKKLKLWRFNFSNPTNNELQQHFLETISIGINLFETLIYIKLLSYGLKHILTNSLTNLLNKPTIEGCCKILFSNLSNRITESDIILNNLINKLKSNEKLYSIFLSYPPDKIEYTLKQSKEGIEWWDELIQYISDFKYYKDKHVDPALEGYIESSKNLVKQLIKELVNVNEPTVHNDSSLYLKSCKTMISKFIKFPFSILLLELIKIAQKLTVINDEEAFYYNPYILILRRTLLLISSKIPLKSLNDIFFLKYKEIEDIFNETQTLSYVLNIIENRKKEYKKVVSPLNIKDEYSITLKGLGISKGKYRGKVTVVKDISNLPKINKGDILVAPYIDPSWQSIIKDAGGIVTEFGGVLSLGAFLARKYNIPMVINVPNVLNLLFNNQIIQIDGDTGVIGIIN